MMFGSFAGVEFGAALTGAGARLQSALVVLGKIVRDSTLSAVKVDGAPGAKTATAASLAFTKYVAGAPAAYKKLTAAKVKSMAATLAMALETEIRKRGGQPAAPATVATAQITTRAAKKTAPKVAAKKAALTTKIKATKKAAAAKKKAEILKGNAIAARATALRFRQQGLKSIADTYDRDAAADEMKAVAAAQEAGTATAEAVRADIATQAAAGSIAQETARAVAEQTAVPSAAMTPEAMPATSAAAAIPEGAISPVPTSALQPTAQEEGFVARNKIAIIAAVGIAALVGGVVVYQRKKGLG